jgi:hypothetical protein
MNKASASFGVKPATTLKTLAFSCSSHLARLAMPGEESSKVALEACGLHQISATQFLSQMGEAVRLHIRKGLAAAQGRVRQATSEGAERLKGVPDPDESEDTYRSSVQRLTGKFTDVQQKLLSDIPQLSSWLAADTGEPSEDLQKLQEDAASVRDQCMLQVCYFSLLSLFRNSQAGSSAMPAREQIAKMGSVLSTMAALPPAPWGNTLLSEMKAFVVPLAGLSNPDMREAGRLCAGFAGDPWA